MKSCNERCCMDERCEFHPHCDRRCPVRQEEATAANKFHEHIEEAIAYNLGLGYRGDLWAWIEPVDNTFKFHVARKPPVGDDGRFEFQVMKFDLGDETKAQAWLAARKRARSTRHGR